MNMNSLLVASLLVAPSFTLAQAGSNPAAAPAGTQPATAGTASASDGAPVITDGRPASAEKSWSLSLTPNAQHFFSTDLRDAPGSYSLSRFGAEADIGLDLGEGWRLAIGLSGDVSVYDFDNATTIIPGAGAEPFDDIYTFRAIPRLSHRLDDKWSYTIGGILEASGESGADVGESISGGGLFSVRYRFNENFSLSGGIGAKSSLGESAFVFPLLGIEWKITEKLRFETRGLGGALTLKVNDAWSVAFEGEYDRHEFRLDDSRATLREGVVRDTRVPIGLSVTYSPTPSIDLTLRGGIVAWQEFRVETRNGTEVSELRSDPAGFVGGGVTFRF